MSLKIIEIEIVYRDYAIVYDDQDEDLVARSVWRQITRDQMPEVDWTQVTKNPYGIEEGPIPYNSRDDKTLVECFESETKNG